MSDQTEMNNGSSSDDLEIAETYNLSAAVVAKLREIFTQFDLDGDGEISIAEITATMKQSGVKASTKSIAAILLTADADHDQVVSFPEFLSALAPKLKAKTQKQDLKEIFDDFDQNGDGQLSDKEFQQAWSQMGEQLSIKEARAMIALSDEDGDGQINYKEFVKMWTEYVTLK